MQFSTECAYLCIQNLPRYTFFFFFFTKKRVVYARQSETDHDVKKDIYIYIFFIIKKNIYIGHRAGSCAQTQLRVPHSRIKFDPIFATPLLPELGSVCTRCLAAC